MIKILPQLFYQTPEINKILVDGLSCIIHKELSEPVLNKEGYVSAHAITLVLKGTLRVEGEMGAIAKVNEKQMIFLPKGLYTISDIIPEKGKFEAIVLFFSEEVIRRFITDHNIAPRKEKCVSWKIMEYVPDVRIFTESLLKLYSNNKSLAKRELTALKLFEFLNILSFSASGCLIETLATIHNKERKGLREFMELNFNKPLGIEDYAYLTGRSISSFRRDFVNQFGVAPKQWLIDMRLNMARKLLSHNHTSVSQVALEVGYENFSHFVKAFHKKYGTPPKQFLMKSRREIMV